ncbi:uncharacterized protein LOC130296214 [Hyla sarda]|uniref:uncharacterized protein LOC130296214 n=1 Tax=Hyla sarda TaxID=327740 RepID=UPI0024C3A843|nr:uncharacterized protein LOC130296214 [Hyla sarda]
MFGTFELRELTEDDSSTYKQWVDTKLVAVINLHVIEPLKEPTLRMFETIHGNQSYIDLECSVQGPELLSMTFLKDGEEITGNITGKGHTRQLTMDACDPGSPGIYTCVVANPLGNKTSPGIKVTEDKNDCKKDPENWIIGFILIIIFSIFICIIAAVTIRCFFVGKSREENRKKLRRCCGFEDLESGRTSDNSSVNENPPGEEQREESVQLIPKESKDDVKVDTAPRLSTEEDSLQLLDMGLCGQDGKPAVNLKENGTASYHAQVSNG